MIKALHRLPQIELWEGGAAHGQGEKKKEKFKLN